MFNTVPFLIRYPFFYSKKYSNNNLVCILCNANINANIPSKEHKCSCRLHNKNVMVKIYSKECVRV